MVKVNLGGNRGAKPDSLIRLGQVGASVVSMEGGFLRLVTGRIEKIDKSGKPTTATLRGDISDKFCGGRGIEEYVVPIPLERLQPVLETVGDTLRFQHLLPHDAFYDFAVRLNMAEVWKLPRETLFAISRKVCPIHISKAVDDEGTDDADDFEQVWKITCGMEVAQGLSDWSRQVDDRIAELRNQGLPERLLMVIEDMLILGVNAIIFSRDHEDALDPVEPAK